MKKRGQGIYVSVYIPEELIQKWKNIKNKSKTIQEFLSAYEEK